MSFRNSITIVASPRPRVGKTLVARLLTDFHLSENRKVVAFDLNSGERTLSQFLPEQTVAASVRDVNGQMALFDRLVTGDDTTKIIDLGHVGASWRDVVKITKYLTDFRDADAMHRTMGKYFGDWRPASTTVCINQLSSPGARVELDMIVALPKKAT